jgi:hypothetical protein
MRRVSPCSDEATKISPRETNATSLPSGETSNSVICDETSVGFTTRPTSSAVVVTARRRLSLAPAGRTHSSPSYA